MNKDIGSSLIDTIKSENLCSIASDGAELFLDHGLKDGVLKDVPVFGTLIKLYGTFWGIKEMIFAKKVYHFLDELKDTNSDERESFLNNLTKNIGDTKKVGIAMIMLLERLDDIDKPTIVGKLYCACIKGEISTNELLRLSNIVERTYIADLKALKKLETREGFTAQEQHSYISSGLMRSELEHPLNTNRGNLFEDIGPRRMEEKTKIRYKFTNEAEVLAQIIFKGH